MEGQLLQTYKELGASPRKALADLRTWILRKHLWVWALPVLVYFFAKHEQARVHTLVELLLGIGLVTLVARHPYKSLTILLLFLPFELITFSLLLRFGVPAQLVRGLGFWKETVLAGLAVAAFLQVRASRPKFDWVDRFVIAYAVLGLAYLVLPHLFLSNTAVGASATFYARELDWRSAVMYVAIFLVCRHLRLSRDEMETLIRRVVVLGTIIAAIGVYEFFRPSSFNHFLVATAQVPVYKAHVLHAPVGTPGNLLTYASNGHVRIGSVFIDNLTDGWYYIVISGLVMEMILRGRIRAWLIGSLLVTSLALAFTQARASIIGGGLTVLFALRSQIGRSLTQRVRMTSMVALLGLAAVPLVVFSGLGHRFVSSHQSNQGHKNGITQGLHLMARTPLGRGLSTGTGGGQTAAAKGLVSASSIFDPENQWLLVGTELGVLALVLYSGSIVGIVSSLKPRGTSAQVASVATAAGGMRNAMFGLIFGTIVAQPFLDNGISWTVFGLCGAAVGALERVQLELGEGEDTAADGVANIKRSPVSHHPSLLT